jgi:hypothetical protein
MINPTNVESVQNFLVGSNANIRVEKSLASSVDCLRHLELESVKLSPM